MLWESVRLALRAIATHALRSALTLLGVVIGVAAVIAMLTVGEASTAQVARDVAKLGHNLLIVRPGQARRGPQTTAGTAPVFDARDVEAIRRQIASARVVAPVNMDSVTAVAGNAHHATSVIGTDAGYLDARALPIARGRGFDAGELRAGAAVCILGRTPTRELFGGGDPLGQSVRLQSIACRVVGVAAELGASSFGTDQDDFVLIPIRTFQRRIAGNADVQMIYVAVRDDVATDRARADIERLMRERRRIAPGEEDDFNVFDMKQIATLLTGTTAVMTGMLAAVAAVSLVVGGIGIMNIMLVSVTERTREIGIRLAVGARAGDIRLQFLIEAVVLSLLGGLIGVLLGIALGAAGTYLLRVPFAVDPAVILVAFGFAAVVGIVFGYLPAARAAGLNPIDALRHA